MICPKCQQVKPRRDFKLRQFYNQKVKYGLWCNRCRSLSNAQVSASQKLSDAYCVSLITQTNHKVIVTADMIRERREQLKRKRLIRAHEKTQRFFALMAASGIIKP